MKLPIKEIINQLEQELVKDPNMIFGVDFRKKDGTIRKMTCRCGVTKYLKGGKPAYNFAEHGLLPVCDMKITSTKKNPYRSLPLERILGLRMKKRVFEVIEQ